ncbi:glutamine--fructose-6-phosphate transaminase (isomerizing) [Chloracidobacterium aggregatum]|uniref:Glutamine--fructose-6-phosphate aminotransferase [isomerizing] n=1 Tax=Chloracidobacterium sp. N TaxID=2821540 RepID=A0ABX8AYP6_9BACT|nr:glutamine--fructose-6-phosphate transaminase (isomerizing) [Chloracidobacterium aggregatum]QUV93837.1 glutamine--fructose-6-phosphate transaminase (isomerizing) [Chloracidobacterium sp. N]QUV97028.1 glutamine--fructose-6-phosphate transaminase (isomerizing) [Chloracidobacterium sp. E]
MCGIVGYVGAKPVVSVLLDGLKRLEYRGYDSAGLAVVADGQLELRRASGKLYNLEAVIQRAPLAGSYGIGHTRWATHGRPTEENAHPHRDASGRVVVVHNGIIENYLSLKRALEQEGHAFATQTDTEVIAHLIGKYQQAGLGLADAVRQAIAELSGMFALAVIAADEPDTIVAARFGPPVIVGLGQEENFVASDVTAILQHTREVVFLEDGQVAVVRANEVTFTDFAGRPVTPTVQRVTWDPVLAEKGGFKHFMLKEIHEQPHAIRETLAGRVSLDEGRVYLDPTDIPDADWQAFTRIVIPACGTSWHAALVGKVLIEELARLPVEVDYASEFRYRNPLLDAQTLVVVITQSGETADTLAALREAKQRGCHTFAICNVPGSMAAREAHGVLLTHAGPEISVASTKAFTSQIVALYLLALHLGQCRGTLSPTAVMKHVEQLLALPVKLEAALEQDAAIAELSREFFRASDFLYLGRGVNFPIALEGALKLKEISYIHAEGFPAGEMKHGPNALIDERLPVVMVMPREVGNAASELRYEKTLSNLQEVKARDGRVIAIVTEGDTEAAGLAEYVIPIPATSELLSAVLAVVPLQLLAYHIAVRRGCDVDQPRNLAKSVTVE